MSKEKSVIKFLRSSSPYGAGEVAGFDPIVADRYVKAGRAVYMDRQMTTDRPVVAPEGKLQPLKPEGEPGIVDWPEDPPEAEVKGTDDEDDSSEDDSSEDDSSEDDASEDESEVEKDTSEDDSKPKVKKAKKGKKRKRLTGDES